MPVYEYRCQACGEISTVVTSVSAMAQSVSCEHCPGIAERIMSRPAVHLSKASKLERLDPKYDRMVDRAMANTQNAEPDRILKKLKPFSGDS